MNEDVRDRALQDRFAALRAEEAQGAPAFSRLSGRDATRRVFSLRWGRLAGAAVALVLLCVAIGRPPAPTHPAAGLPAPAPLPTPVAQTAQPAEETSAWAVLPTWKAATDSFLPSSGGPWGSTVTTTTDVWMTIGSGDAEQASSNGKGNS